MRAILPLAQIITILPLAQIITILPLAQIITGLAVMILAAALAYRGGWTLAHGLAAGAGIALVLFALRFTYSPTPPPTKDRAAGTVRQ